MFAVETTIGMAALAVFSLVVMRRCRAENAEEEVCRDDRRVNRWAGEPELAAWCDALESVSGSAVLCFDPSMRLRAFGCRAKTVIKGDPDRNGSHLFDVLPADVARPLVALIASARRGSSAEIDVDWDSATAGASALPLADGWALLRLKIKEEVHDGI